MAVEFKLPSLLIAPTEPPLIQALGRVSSATESFGADIIGGIAGFGLIAIQRKADNDLYASMMDGRNTREFEKALSKAQMTYLIVERQPRFKPNGECMNPHQRWTRSSYRRYLMSIQARGIKLHFTEDVADTCEAVEDIFRWASKPNHRALLTVPNMRGAFDLPPTGKERQSFLLQALCEGIGPVRAMAVVEHFGGRVPIRWDCAKKELLAVHGVGKISVESLWNALPHDDSAAEEKPIVITEVRSAP